MPALRLSGNFYLKLIFSQKLITAFTKFSNELKISNLRFQSVEQVIAKLNFKHSLKKLSEQSTHCHIKSVFNRERTVFPNQIIKFYALVAVVEAGRIFLENTDRSSPS